MGVSKRSTAGQRGGQPSAQATPPRQAAPRTLSVGREVYRGLALGVAAGLLVVAAFLALRHYRPAAQEVPADTASAARAEQPPTLVLSSQPQALSPGSTRLADGIELELSDSGAATVARQGSTTQVRLTAGSLVLRTEEQATTTAEVFAGGFRFAAARTYLQVRWLKDEISLAVHAGNVAVSRESEPESQLALLKAGQIWSERRMAAIGAVPSSSAEVPLPSLQSCLAQLRVRPQEARQCLERLAGAGGREAGTAQFELAKLYRDVFDDSRAALAACQRYQSAFPQGAHRHEVDYAAVRLLAALGESAQAIQESERLVGGALDRQQTAELRLLRGDILRAQGQCERAVREYALIAGAAGELGQKARIGSDACRRP